MFRDLRYLNKDELVYSTWEGKWNYETRALGEFEESITSIFSEAVIMPFSDIQSEPWLDYERVLINALRNSFYDVLENIGVKKVSIHDKQIIIFKDSKQIRAKGSLKQYSGCLYLPRQEDNTRLSKIKFIANLAYNLVEALAYTRLFITHSQTILVVMLDQKGFRGYQSGEDGILPYFEVLNEVFIMSIAKKVVHQLTYKSLSEICKSEEEVEAIKFGALEIFNLSPHLAYFYLFAMKNELTTELMSDFLFGTDRVTFKLFEEGKMKIMLPWTLMENNHKSLFKGIKANEGKNAKTLIKLIKAKGVEFNRGII